MNISISTNEPIQATKAKPMSLNGTQTLEGEKAKLYKATKEMESLFLNQLLKTMRQTIPKSDMNEGFGLGQENGKDIYTQMFDEELALKMAGISDKSLASQLYRSLEKILIAQFDENSESKTGTIEINNALPQRNYIKVSEETPKAVEIDQKTRPVRNDKILDGQYGRAIKKVADKYQLNPALVSAVIKAESNGDPNAVSPAGAKGLMQLMDSTAADLGVKNIYNPEENIEGGARYLRQMIDLFGDIKKALAAYNAGPETVKRYKGIPPYTETQNYIERVLDSLKSQEPYY